MFGPWRRIAIGGVEDINDDPKKQEDSLKLSIKYEILWVTRGAELLSISTGRFLSSWRKVRV